MINVTKSYLPNKDKYKKYVDEIYENGWLTNQGPLVQRLEKRLAEYLGVKNIVLVSNGTIALEIAYRAMELKGEVITTPFSFVATTSSLVTNNLSPIFADIDEKTFNLNPKNIEEKTVFEKSEPQEWICTVCGYVHVGNEAPKVCPACKHTQGYYEVRADNF